MDYNLKTFWYDNRGHGIQDKIDADIAAFLTGVGATQLGDMTVVASNQSMIAAILYSTDVAPTVTTQAVSVIASTTATGNGNITSLGVPNPTAHGVCWSDSDSPTVADSNTDEGAAASTGAFTSDMTGLTPSTTYYVRAYATNSAGTVYGNLVSFATTA